MNAYSYTRFSTKEQLKGNSQVRQDTGFADFCRKFKLEPQELSFHDHGKSGYSGKNLEGDLGRFLALIPSLPKPSVLVIEAFDRLSRQRPDKTIALLSKILESGISLGIIFMGDIITVEDLATYKFQMISGAVTEAHASSKNKSDRIKKGSDWKRQNRIKKHKYPCWLALDPTGQLVIDIDAKAVIKQIFEMALTMGNRKIAAHLNQHNIPPIAAGYSSRANKLWTVRFLEHLLTNRQVIGYNQYYQIINGKRVPMGESIPNYYPAVIDEDLFYAVQSAQRARNTLKQRDHQEHYICLFTGLWHDAKTKSNMRLVSSNKAEKKAGCNRRFASYHAEIGKSKNFTSWRYEEFELVFLAYMHEITSETLAPQQIDNRLPALEGKRAELMSQVAETKKKMKGKDFSLLLQLLTELQTELDANTRAIEAEKERLAIAKNQASGEFKKAYEVFQANPRDEELKLQLRAIIAQLVSEIWIAIEDYGTSNEGKHLRILTCQVFMKDGRQKIFLLSRNGRTVSASGTESYKTNLDLRKWDGKPLINYKRQA